jgi:hypothetical protein
VQVHRVRVLLVELGHERHRQALLDGDLLGRLLVDDVASDISRKPA